MRTLQASKIILLLQLMKYYKIHVPDQQTWLTHLVREVARRNRHQAIVDPLLKQLQLEKLPSMTLLAKK
jgi:hypothetical protein